ncbi:hypothetical protein FHU10_0226 [Serratia fonticola]|uniref:Uncharacterized protein n=1 Tax=Serratia fonticola TaxID=47917 RepID=A0A559SZP9_SERFO|nr:hypothetical protein [Serratia fonticola]TQI79675.1 hypothetical protein FHU09_2223 [Serratia fonticola]TQI98299.1 hypothetical protein FHU11_3824 [Serratia fonticola]TVZ67827.1 hypothetical protein FHU10_0226 [Serratia fonticola]
MNKKLIFIFCLLGTISSAANAQADKIIYRSVFDMKYAFCSIKTNGVIGQDNRNSAGNGRGFGTGSTSAILLMENGENDIAVEMASVNWFDPEVKDDDKNSFRKDAYCNLDLIKYNKQGSQTISNIKITIDDTGKPTAKNSATPEKYQSINQPIVEQHLTGFEVKPGFIKGNPYAELWFPKGMKIYEFSRKVTADGLPEWPWVKATPYTDTPEQRQLLQQAYGELWQAFNNKDMNKIKKLMALSFRAFAYVTDSTEDEILRDRAFYEQIKERNIKMAPINWDAYEVKVMNKGRMVRLINKSEPDASPITYERDNGKTSFTAPFFSLINGRFVVVL